MKTLTRKRTLDQRAFHPEPLEPRGLRTVGVSSFSNVLDPLGVISPSAAVRGVEATATIGAGHSITFEFQAVAAGEYELKVRHLGGGLTLEARGPGGSASINPGPAGPFETLVLPISEGSYQVQATAIGDQAVFVDWELLLVSGVGQAPSQSSALLAPASLSLPLPGPSTTAVVPSTFGSPTNSSTPVSSIASNSVHGGPVGRPVLDRPIAPVGPLMPRGMLSIAYNGDGLPPGILLDDIPETPDAQLPITIASISTARHDLETLALDEAALDAQPWLSRLAQAIRQAIRPSEPLEEEAVSMTYEDIDHPAQETESNSMAGLGPAMAVGVLATLLASRRKLLGSSRGSLPSRDGLWLRAAGERTPAFSGKTEVQKVLGVWGNLGR